MVHFGIYGAFICVFFIHFSVFISAQNSPALVPSCNPNPCKNNGQCVTKNGQNFCKCDIGYVGSLCQFRDPCNPSQCQSGGTCNVNVNDIQGPRFTCTCPIGYTASLCEIPLPNACDNNPCLNRGTCQLITLNQSKCICPNGYLGDHCEILDHCAPEPCKNGATCISSSTDSSYKCQCAEGFQGEICTDDVDECTINGKSPCVYGTCVNLLGSYRCDCRQGYTGKNCDQIYVPCAPSPCQNGGQCIIAGQYKYFCQCPAGFTGKNCDQNIDDCQAHQCQNGGKCVDGLNAYTCKCPPTHRGQFCTDDIDECQENKNMCQNGGTCQNTIGGFQCICVNGWEGKFCQTNHDDCERQQCFNGGTCIDRVASFTCNCTIGWTGLLCHLRDACMSSPCQGRGKCDTNPVDGGYLCSCESGFKGGDCSLDIDECANDNPCEHGGTCVNTPGSYRCECPQGWTGQFCDQNVNECASHPCQNDATCLDDVGRFICVCRPGFTGIYCETNLNDRECASAPCLNGGQCRSVQGGFQCQCLPGFSGNRCEINLDDCASKPCENNGTCIDGIGQYTCKCLPGFIGNHCETSIADRICSSTPCFNGGRCRANMNGGYTCECLTGFSGDRCQIDVDECSINPCRNGARCENGPGSYVCRCSRGFTGKNCEINENDCTPNSCLNGGTCLDGTNNFTCQCPGGFRGKNCELKDNLDGLYKEVEIRESEMCRINNCEKKADDGTCHPECNYYACGFDGDDCSGGLKPFQRCSSPCYCWHRFQDGTCDPECNNEGCLFDGYDCKQNGSLKKDEICNPLFVAYCTSHYGDGHCDSGCNTAGCGYDGGDCDKDEKLKQPLQGQIVMIVTVDPEVFINNTNRFLMVVGKLVDATVNIQKDDEGRLMIYRWNSRDGVDKKEPVSATAYAKHGLSRGKRQSWSSSTPAPFLTGTLVVLTVDISRCIEAGRTDCFQEIISVADFLGAASAKEALKSSLGWDVYSISADKEKPDGGEGQKQPTIIMVASVVGAIALVFLVAIVLVRQKRKVIQTVLWYPPKQGETSSTIGNDYVDQKNLKRKLGPLVGGGTPKTDFGHTNSSVYGAGSQLGDYLQWPDHGRCDTYSQCSDNETYSTYAESQCTAIATPVPCPQPPTKRVKVAAGYGAPNFMTAVEEPRVTWPQVHVDAATLSVDQLKEKFKFASKEQIHAKGPDNVTPFMTAIKSGDGVCEIPICNELIRCGADLNEQTETYGDSALILAVKHCRTLVARLIVQSGVADPNLADEQGYTALHHAVAMNNKEMIEILLECRQTNIEAETDEGYTPLLLSAKLIVIEQADILHILLNAGAKVTHKDKEGRTALHWAALHNSPKAVELLIQKGAEKDAQDGWDQTALFLASREGSYESARKLLELGANKEITDQKDHLPRDIAYENGHKSIFQLLESKFLASATTQLIGQHTFDYSGTMPRNFSRQNGAESKPKRSKSFKETGKSATSPDNGQKVKKSKKSQQQHQQLPIQAAPIATVCPTYFDIASIDLGHRPCDRFQSNTAEMMHNYGPNGQIVSAWNDHYPQQHSTPTPNAYTSIQPSTPYSYQQLQQQHEMPQQKESFYYHQQGNQQSQTVSPPSFCSFSPPQCASNGSSGASMSYGSPATSNGSGNSSMNFVHSPPYHPMSNDFNAWSNRGMVFDGYVQ